MQRRWLEPRRKHAAQHCTAACVIQLLLVACMPLLAVLGRQADPPANIAFTTTVLRRVCCWLPARCMRAAWHAAAGLRCTTGALKLQDGTHGVLDAAAHCTGMLQRCSVNAMVDAREAKPNLTSVCVDDDRGGVCDCVDVPQLKSRTNSYHIKRNPGSAFVTQLHDKSLVTSKTF